MQSKSRTVSERWARVAAVATAVALAAGATGSAAAAGAGGARGTRGAGVVTVQAPEVTGKWVSGYYAGWFWDWYPPSVVDMSTMTHFIFGRYAPGGGTLGGTFGQLVQGAGTGHADSVEQFLVNKAHAGGVKALMMVGGAGDGPGFDGSTANATVRTTFINNILSKIQAKNYDGVDIDWEENLDTTAQRNQVVALLTELRAAAAVHPHFQPPHAPIIITWPAFWVSINFPVVEPWNVTVASLVDQYNIMTYSMAGDWPGWTSWHHSALGDAQPTHPTAIDTTVQSYVAAGVPRAKLGIGIGLYGIYYTPPVTAPRQSLGASSAQPDDVENNYRRLVAEGAFTQPGGTYHWDAAARQSYYTYSPAWNRYGNTPISYLTYEDEASIGAKGQWVRENGVGGTLVWTINYGCTNSSTGANALMNAVKNAFLVATPVELQSFTLE